MAFNDLSISPKGAAPTEADRYFSGERDFDAEKAFKEEEANAKQYICSYLTGEPMVYPEKEVLPNKDLELIQQFLTSPDLVIKIIKGHDEDVTHITRGSNGKKVVS